MTASTPEVGLVSRIRVAEIFGPTIQGEGSVIGCPTVFVRTGGCDYRCAWCDSLHAVLPEYRPTWTPMTPGAIIESVRALTGGKPILVTLSGGNPALQPMEALIVEGRAQGLTFALETQGSAPRSWFRLLDVLTISPKPPSSGERTDLGKLRESLVIQHASERRLHPRAQLKIVVFDAIDLEFVAMIRSEFVGIPLTVQVGNDDVQLPPADADRARVLQWQADHRAVLLERYAWLSAQVLARKWFEVRVLPQLHTLTWGNARGV